MTHLLAILVRHDWPACGSCIRSQTDALFFPAGAAAVFHTDNCGTG